MTTKIQPNNKKKRVRKRVQKREQSDENKISPREEQLVRTRGRKREQPNEIFPKEEGIFLREEGAPPPKKLRSYAQLVILRRIVVRQLSLFLNSTRAASNWNLVETTIEIWNRIAQSDQVSDLRGVENKWKLDLFTMEATALCMLYQCVVLCNDNENLVKSVTDLYKVLFDTKVDQEDSSYDEKRRKRSEALAAATKSVYEILKKLLGVIPSGFLTLSTMVVEVELYKLAAKRQKTLQQSISVLSVDWASKISRMGYIDPASVEKFNWNLYTQEQPNSIPSPAEILKINEPTILRNAIFALIDEQEAYIDNILEAYEASSSNLVK
jgi:hypothetical protein